MNKQLLRTRYSVYAKKSTNAEIIKTIRKWSVLIFLLLHFATVLHTQIKLDSGLVAYYPFNGNANVVSGNGKNVTVYGSKLSSYSDSLY
jgi:hypothetical protein